MPRKVPLTCKTRRTHRERRKSPPRRLVPALFQNIQPKLCQKRFVPSSVHRFTKTILKSYYLDFLKHYPVLEIITQMKRGRRVKESAEEMIRRLKNCEVQDFSDADRTAIHKAVGPWLMANAAEKYFFFLSHCVFL